MMAYSSATKAYSEGYSIGRNDPNGRKFQCKYLKDSEEYEEFSEGYLDGQNDYWNDLQDSSVSDGYGEWNE